MTQEGQKDVPNDIDQTDGRLVRWQDWREQGTPPVTDLAGEPNQEEQGDANGKQTNPPLHVAPHVQNALLQDRYNAHIPLSFDII